MNFKSRLTTAIATGAVLLNALAPVAFAQDVTITGNGATSQNTVNSTSASNTTVSQNNTATVNNVVTSNATTGGNSADFNTGGNTTVKSGNATNNVGVSNALNLNKASVDCCAAGNTANVTISDNGATSINTANVTNVNNTTLGQSNNAVVSNVVTANSTTGGNSASFNTGGDTAVVSGNASTTVDVVTKANANVANIGGGVVVPGPGGSVTITGNGAGSLNTVNLTNTSSTVLGQTNYANVSNVVTANASTGGNSASFNTGGDTFVLSGDAKTNVGVHNLLNFNGADLDCGCLFADADLKIGLNGATSINRINEVNADVLVAGQANLAALYNVLSENASTGGNSATFNTTGSDDDPLVWSGNAESNAGVSNAGNVNWLDNGTVLSLPGDWSLVLSFSWFGLLPWWA